jgi:hypothetical protein
MNGLLKKKYFIQPNAMTQAMAQNHKTICSSPDRHGNGGLVVLQDEHKCQAIYVRDSFIKSEMTT